MNRPSVTFLCLMLATLTAFYTIESQAGEKPAVEKESCFRCWRAPVVAPVAPAVTPIAPLIAAPAPAPVTVVNLDRMENKLDLLLMESVRQTELLRMMAAAATRQSELQAEEVATARQAAVPMVPGGNIPVNPWSVPQLPPNIPTNPWTVPQLPPNIPNDPRTIPADPRGNLPADPRGQPPAPATLPALPSRLIVPSSQGVPGRVFYTNNAYRALQPNR